MIDIIQWFATIATVTAAFITASNLGSRITGYGFGVFLAGSLAWIATGILSGQSALTATNVVLTLLNIFGMWRWLGRQAAVEDGGERASKRSRAGSGEDLFPLSMLTRAPVKIGGSNAGKCVDAMAGCQSGAIRYLVISDGGLAGVGETFRRVDWDSAEACGDEVVVAVDSVEQLQTITKDQWPAR